DAVAKLDADLVILGEMGIGNTTPAAAVAATLFGGPAEEWTGRGTGVDDETWARKVRAVEAARARIAPDASPMEILREAGGAELAAIAGAMVEARARSIPVLLDGLVVTAAGARRARHRARDPLDAGRGCADRSCVWAGVLGRARGADAVDLCVTGDHGEHPSDRRPARGWARRRGRCVRRARRAGARARDHARP